MPIELGIVPEIFVPNRYRIVSEFRSPMESGIVPEISVFDRYRIMSDERLPIESGIVPERLVSNKPRNFNAFNSVVLKLEELDFGCGFGLGSSVELE